jgi:hypothetical protein
MSDSAVPIGVQSRTTDRTREDQDGRPGASDKGHRPPAPPAAHPIADAAMLIGWSAPSLAFMKMT